MEKTPMQRFEQVQALAARDQTYQELIASCAALDGKVLEILERLPEEDRQTIREYLRLVGTSALRLTEIACEMR